jgi:chromosome segregation ATPase
MPEDNEKIEDFVSLWKKKMEKKGDKPSAIGEILERIKQVEKENELLRNKIKDNIDLINKTEQVINSTLDENKRLKEQLKQTGKSSGSGLSDLQQKNVSLNNKLIELEKMLAEKEVELRARSNEKIELEAKLEADLKSSASAPTIDHGETTTIIEGLKSDLSKKKSQIDELHNKINELTEENEALNQQLVKKMKSLPIDYVVPVEQPKPTVIKPKSPQQSTETLERLCQDLQQDLNKYKRHIEELNKEKEELKKNLVNGGFALEPEELKKIKKENESLKNELLLLQDSLKQKQKEPELSPQIHEKINNLEVQLKEKDHLIAELKINQQTQPVAAKGPISSLVDDLQSKINKLKIEIKEKDKIIEELQSS